MAKHTDEIDAWRVVNRGLRVDLAAAQTRIAVLVKGIRLHRALRNVGKEDFLGALLGGDFDSARDAVNAWESAHGKDVR